MFMSMHPRPFNARTWNEVDVLCCKGDCVLVLRVMTVVRARVGDGRCEGVDLGAYLRPVEVMLTLGI